MGDMKIAPYDVWQAITGNGDAMANMVVNKFRMPRILIAILVGIALAIAGCILQGLVRNPLASPDIIGITGGASVAVVLFLAIFSDKNNALTVSIHYMPLAAFVGATIVALFVYLFAWRNDGLSPISLVLIGVGFLGINESGNDFVYVISANLSSKSSECMDYGYCLRFFMAKCHGTCAVGSHFNGNIIYSC